MDGANADDDAVDDAGADDTGVAGAGGAMLALMSARDMNFSSHCALGAAGAIPISLVAFANPSMDT